ncbi:hypothetical protein [Terasakiella pusilla]
MSSKSPSAACLMYRVSFCALALTRNRSGTLHLVVLDQSGRAQWF